MKKVTENLGLDFENHHGKINISVLQPQDPTSSSQVKREQITWNVFSDCLSTSTVAS